MSQPETRTGNPEAHEHARCASHLAELGAVAAMYAHEVNNQLTHLAGRAQLALMREDDRELSEHALRAVGDCCDRIERLTRLFLSDGGAIEPDRHQLRSSIRQIHESVCRGIRGSDRDRLGITLDDASEGYAPDMLPIVLEQVLQNLVLNAVRAIDEHPEPDDPSHSIRVVVSRCSTWNTPAAESGLEIMIEDTGVGMSDRQLNQLNAGEPIEPPTHAKSREHTRHGLGLRVCRKLLDTVGGSLHAISSHGHGARVVVRVPAIRIDAHNAREAA